jgi:hypothetical protein
MLAALGVIVRAEVRTEVRAEFARLTNCSAAPLDAKSQPDWLTVQQTMARLGCCENMVHKMRKRKHKPLRWYQPTGRGGRIYIDPDSLPPKA